MAQKKDKRKKSKKKPARRKKVSALNRFWRRHGAWITRIAVWGIPSLAVVVGLVLIVSYLTGRSRLGEKGDLVEQARQHLVRNQLEAAQLAYHQAQNVDPDDKQLSREITMFNQRARAAAGGSISNAIAAAAAVVVYDSTSAIGHLLLAQFLGNKGDNPNMAIHAHDVLRYADPERHAYLKTSAAVYLSSGFRQQDQFDSAYYYSRQAVAWAEETGDTFDLVMARSNLGYAALHIDSLEESRRLFTSAMGLVGSTRPAMHDMVQLGLADYFYRKGEFDSSLAHAAPVEARNLDNKRSPNYAFAVHLQGRVLKETGQNSAAIDRLTESARAWQDIRGYSDLIDNYNELAQVYFKEADYFSARKYYLAASRVADAYGLPHRNKLNINLNNTFLQNLTSDRYVQAGTEGEQLAADVTAQMDFLR